VARAEGGVFTRRKKTGENDSNLVMGHFGGEKKIMGLFKLKLPERGGEKKKILEKRVTLRKDNKKG